MLAAVVWLGAEVCAAENPSPITLDTNETLFSVLAAMNSCGYDADLNLSDAQRLNIRAEVDRNLQGSDEARASQGVMCEWYQAHRGRDAAHELVAVCVAGALFAGATAFSSQSKRR